MRGIAIRSRKLLYAWTETAGRWLLFICLSAAVVLAFSYARAETNLPMFLSADLSMTGDTAPVDAVSLYEKRTGCYLLLPAAWNSDKLLVYCPGGETLYIGDTAYHSGDRVSLSPGTQTVMAMGDIQWQVTVLQSALIPSVFITTDHPDTIPLTEESFKDKTIRDTGACKIVNADGTREYNGALDYIRVRGNSTKSTPKKPYQIKLAKSAPLFGMSSDKTWVLLANYVDKTLIRSSIALDIARYSGVYAFVPGAQPVDLYINHQYYGSFLLTEKCEIDAGRLNITDLEGKNETLNRGEYASFGPAKYGYEHRKGVQLENDPDDITGGYLVLATIWQYYEMDPSGFVTRRGQPFVVDSPKEVSEREIAYISDLFQRIEDALRKGGVDKKGVRWNELLDETTFVHRYLLAEVTGDNDGNLPYYYKDSDRIDGKVYCGPVWDQDNIWGANKEHENPERFYIKRESPYLWFPAAWSIPEFGKLVRKNYREVYLPALEILLGQRTDPEGVLRSLDEYAAEIAASAAMDNIRWPITAHRGSTFTRAGDTPEENIAFLRDYITRRKNFLDLQWLVDEAQIEAAQDPYADLTLPYFISADASMTGSTLPTDAVSIFQKRSGYYLFLPAAWDSDRLIVLCGRDQTLYIGDTSYRLGDRVSLPPGTETVMAIGDTQWPVTVVQSTDVPAVFIVTDHPNNIPMTAGAFNEKSVSDTGACKAMDADGTCEYSGLLDAIHVRGDATLEMPKKAYQIKLSQKTALFGMSGEKDWTLLANFMDKSLIRTTIAMDLARYSGAYAFVPGTQAVDLYMNHQYYGSYLLTEKREVGAGRLEMTDLEGLNKALNRGTAEPFGATEYAPEGRKGILLKNEPEDITGGYLVAAVANEEYGKDPSGFVTSRGQAFLMDSPKEASEGEIDYISRVFQRIEDALYGGGKAPDGTAWTELLDETTFVHRYLLAEITGDADGAFPYFYKDSDRVDAKVYCGPVWDQDNIWGADMAHQRAEGFYILREDDDHWFSAAWRLPEFEALVKKTYREVYVPALEVLLGERTDPSGVLRSLDEYAAEVAGTAALENIRWRIAAHRLSTFNLTGDTPQENIEFLRDYITRRKQFLDAQWLDGQPAADTETQKD